MKIVSLSCLFILLFACKVTGPASTLTQNTLKKYCVGKGGDFTKIDEEYILYENGEVYKRDFNYDREIFQQQLSSVALDYFIEKINSLGIEGIEINEPGRSTFYIEVKEGELSINKVIWGARLYYAPVNLVNFHKELFDKLAEAE